MGSNVRGSILSVTLWADAMSVLQGYRGARSSRAGTEGSLILNGCHRSLTRTVDKGDVVRFTTKREGITYRAVLADGCGTESE